MKRAYLKAVSFCGYLASGGVTWLVCKIIFHLDTPGSVVIGFMIALACDFLDTKYGEK